MLHSITAEFEVQRQVTTVNTRSQRFDMTSDVRLAFNRMAFEYFSGTSDLLVRVNNVRFECFSLK
jgi:hypothetical protein